MLPTDAEAAPEQVQRARSRRPAAQRSKNVQQTHAALRARGQASGVYVQLM
jgi:hypothetical protein